LPAFFGVIYGHGGTHNFVLSSGWYKMSLVLTVAAVVIAVIWAWLGGVWEEFADLGAAKRAGLVAAIVAAGGYAFYVKVARVAPQVITAVAGETAQMEAVISSARIIRGGAGYNPCSLTSDAELINADKSDDSIQAKLAGVYGTVRIAASIPGGFYRTRVEICIDERERRQLPESGAFAAVLHGKQTAAGFLIEKLEAAES
jgi:hypothetical protein